VVLLHVVDVGKAQAHRAVQVDQHGRVEVAAAGDHHQALQRSEPHRGVDAAPGGHGGGAGAVAEVQDDEAHRLEWTAEQDSGLFGDVAV
jgi:hypothetical protein